MRLTHRQMIEVVHLSPVGGGRSFEEDNMRILSLLGAGRTHPNIVGPIRNKLPPRGVRPPIDTFSRTKRPPRSTCARYAKISRRPLGVQSHR
jgi:hypothetical protein